MSLNQMRWQLYLKELVEETKNEILQELSPQERLKGLTIKRLAGLTPKELRQVQKEIVGQLKQSKPAE